MNPLTILKRFLRFVPLRSPVRMTPEIKRPGFIPCPTSNCDRYGHVIAAQPP